MTTVDFYVCLCRRKFSKLWFKTVYENQNPHSRANWRRGRQHCVDVDTITMNGYVRGYRGPSEYETTSSGQEGVL